MKYAALRFTKIDIFADAIAQLKTRFSIIKNNSGIVAVEMALLLPFLLLMFIGLVEVTRYILITQKAEKTATAVSDIVAQATTVTTADLDLILAASANMMNPYSLTNNGVVIVSSVTKTGTANPKVGWQRKGGGTLNKNSKIGAVGAFATLPSSLTLADKDNVIIAEMYYQFVPIMGDFLLGNRLVYRNAYFKPRLGALNTLN